MSTMASSLPVSIASDQSPIAVTLPPGAATEASLLALSAKLPATLGVKAGAASTSVVLASDQAPISTADARLPTALGQALMAASLAVVLPSNQSAIPVTDNGGSLTVDAVALPLPTGASTESSLSALSAKLPATLGQKAMAASMAVALASDQSAIPITAASLPLPTGASTETTLAAASAKLPATLGQKVMAASLAVALASDQSSLPTTEARLPTALGPQAMATALGVTIATDQVSSSVLTFSSAVTGLAAVASGTDLFTITASASKTVRILQLEVFGTATAATLFTLFVIKRATANTGGTAASASMVPHSTVGGASATAFVQTWSANATALGTPVGNIACKRLIVPAVASPSIDTTWTWDWRGPNQSPIVLVAGGAQMLALNLGGVTLTGGLFTIRLVWTET